METILLFTSIFIISLTFLILFVLKDIKTELRYRNILMEKQNEILKSKK